MELPPFDTQGTGPQGSGGIPPEAFRVALKDAGSDLIGANLKPEDSDVAQQVMQREVESLATQQGYQEASPAQPQAPAQPTTPSLAAPQAPLTGTAPGDTPDPRRQAVENIIARYGDMDNLAKGYLEANAARHAAIRAANENKSEISRLEGMVKELYGMVSSALVPQPQAPRAEDFLGMNQPPQYQAQPQAAAPSPETASDPWQNPEPFFRRIVDESVRANLVAMKQVEQRQAQVEKFKEKWDAKQQEVQRLMPRIQRLYQRHQRFYAAMPESEALDKILEDAQSQEAAELGLSLYQELKANGSIATPQIATPPPAVGGSPVNGTSTPRSPGQQTAQLAGGNWSETPGMKRLWNTRDGTLDETEAATRVLRERGFHENVPIY